MMDTTHDLKKATSRKSTPVKSAIALIIVLIGVIASFGFSFYITQVDMDSHDRINDLRRMLINIESNAFEAQLGDSEAFNQLFGNQQAVETTLEALLNTPMGNKQAVIEFANQWRENSKNIDQLLNAEQTIRLNHELTVQMEELFPQIESKTEEVIASLIGLNVEPNLVFLASHQLSLLQAMQSNVHHLENKQRDATRTLDLIESDAEVFNSTIEKLLSGDPTVGIDPIRNVQARNSIESLKADFAKAEEIIRRLADLMVRLNISKNAYKKVHDETHELFESSNELAKNFSQDNIINLAAMSSGYILATIGLFLAGTLLFPKKTEPEITEFEAVVKDEEEPEINEALKRLEKQIAPIAEGDLSANIDIEPGPTESIATSFNYSLNALRALIKNINATSVEVANVAEDAQATSIHLSFASDKQAKQISTVTNAIGKIVTLFETMAEHAEESASLAIKAMSMAENGSLAVKNTIASMKTIDEDIHETSSRVKRLGESSQEIGDIIQLINDIAEQTNLLALNAAIKASAANTETHDFGNVADEIQQLAERVTQATQKVESLVTSIQLDTNQAVLAMEQSSTDVVNGTKLAEAAGDALVRIESVSAHLAQFIDDVAGEATSIYKSANKISSSMNNIKKFTDQNLAGTKQTASLNGKLAALAKAQREAVNGFKLPTNDDNPTSEA